MQEELKSSLVDTVQSSVEVLNDDDALAIVQICKRAVNREIANVSEQYLADSIEGHATRRSGEDEVPGEK